MAAKRTKSLKDRLIDATIRGIEKVGVENLSLRKIAADCGVTHATAYKYFENKQDLISVCCGRIAVRVQAYLARSMHDAPEPYVAMCKSYLRYMVRHPQFHALLHMSPLTKRRPGHPGAARQPLRSPVGDDPGFPWPLRRACGRTVFPHTADFHPAERTDRRSHQPDSGLPGRRRLRAGRRVRVRSARPPSKEPAGRVSRTPFFFCAANGMME